MKRKKSVRYTFFRRFLVFIIQLVDEKISRERKRETERAKKEEKYERKKQSDEYFVLN